MTLSDLGLKMIIIVTWNRQHFYYKTVLLVVVRTYGEYKTSMSVLIVGRVACCPLVSHGEYADGTDGQTERTQDRYITLSARRGQR